MTIKTEIDFSLLPRHVIEVADLQSPYDICRYFEIYKIDYYVYQINYKGICLKFGMSADNSKNYGERLYRQIAHAESWGDKRISGSSGADWRIVEDDFYRLYGIKIDMKDVTIRIWDATHYPFETMTPWDEVVAMETKLIEQYESLMCKKPIGNINDNANVIRRPKVRKGVFQDLFQIIVDKNDQ